MDLIFCLWSFEKVLRFFRASECGRKETVHLSRATPNTTGKTFSVWSWFRSDAEELEGSKIYAGHSGQPSRHRRDTRVMSCSCALTTCDHLESNWKGFRLNCNSLFLNWSNLSCPMGYMKGTPGSLRNSDLSGMIPVWLNRTSCLCVNSILWILQLGRLVELVQVGMVVLFSRLKAGTAVIFKSVKGLKDKKKTFLNSSLCGF